MRYPARGVCEGLQATVYAPHRLLPPLWPKSSSSCSSLSVIFKRHTLPELVASACLVRAVEKGDDLARPTAQRRPQPTFTCRFVTHKRPHLIQLQYIVCLHRQQRLDQQWHLHSLLYQPTAHRLAVNPKHALKPAQTDALCTSPQNRRFLLWRIACFRLQHPIHTTVFTMVLRIATFIRTIFDYICTATGTGVTLYL